VSGGTSTTGQNVLLVAFGLGLALFIGYFQPLVGVIIAGS